MADCWWWWGGHLFFVGGAWGVDLWVKYFTMPMRISNEVYGSSRFVRVSLLLLRKSGNHSFPFETSWLGVCGKTLFAMDSSSPSIAVSYDSIERDVDL